MEDFESKLKALVDRVCESEAESDYDADLVLMAQGRLFPLERAYEVAQAIDASIPLQRRFAQVLRMIEEIETTEIDPVALEQIPPGTVRAVLGDVGRREA